MVSFGIADKIPLSSISEVMVADKFAKLLILQDRDARHTQLVRQRDHIPVERAQAEASIADEQQRRLDLQQLLKQLEVRRKELEGSTQAAEETIRKYLNQQLQVKKNEEYMALAQEIELVKGKISETEDEELAVLEAIDEQKAENARAEEEIAERIRIFEAELKRLDEIESNVVAEIDSASQAVGAAEAEVDPVLLATYRFVKTQVKRPPVIVPLQEGRCMGCHIKVSGDVESGTRKGEEIVRCDSCGRIVYHDR